MKHSQWPWSNDVPGMLSALRARRRPEDGDGAREARLFALACVRRVRAHFPDDRCERLLDAAERCADGLETRASLERAWLDAHVNWLAGLREHGPDVASQVIRLVLACANPDPDAWTTAVAVAIDATAVAVRDVRSWTGVLALQDEAYAQADLLRDVFGDPWRPVVGGDRDVRRYALRRDGSRRLLGSSSRAAWTTPTVLALAYAACEHRRPDGTLEPARLGILSDAIEEAGGDDVYLLGHLRGDCGRCGGRGRDEPGRTCDGCGGRGRRAATHVAGCWALDLILKRRQP